MRNHLDDSALITVSDAMDFNDAAAWLFIIGSLIFFADGALYLRENGWNLHNLLYTVGSLIFAIGSMLWHFGNITQDKERKSSDASNSINVSNDEGDVCPPSHL